MNKHSIPRKQAFLGLHFDLHPGKNDTQLGAHITEEMISHLLETVSPDYVQYDCKGHAGYTGYPTKIGWPSPGIQQDSLAIWRKVTKEYGVRLFIHYSGVWDSVALDHHPEWACQNADGEPDRNATSTFGDYCDAFLIPQLKEVADAYDLDGVWVDGDCWATRVDYSPAAREVFTEATGIAEIPMERGAPHWQEFITFQRQQFLKYVTKYVDVLHAHKPGFEITSNWLYSTLVPEEPTAPIDFISGDFSPGDSVNTARLEARYISSAGLPWDLMAWGFNKGDSAQWSHKPAVQLQQEAAIVLAQGGGFQTYYQPTRAGWLDDWLMEIMGEVASFCRERQAVSHGTEPVTQVSLLLPGQSFYATSSRPFGPWGDLLNPTQGVLHALLESHYSVDVMAEYRLIERLEDYPVVVIPECDVLAEGLRDALLAYAQNGGNLLLIGAQTAAVFADVLGVEFAGEPQETTTYVQGGRSLAWVGGTWQTVEPSEAECIGVRYATTDTRQEAFCAASLNPYGKGKIGAIYGPLGSQHYRSHYPAAREFVGSVMKRFMPKPLVEIDGPPCIDVAVRGKDGKLLIHLTNLAGMQTASRYALIDSVPPVGPLTLRVRLDDPPEQVSIVPSGMSVEQHWEEGILHIALPRLPIHEVVVIE